MRMIAPAVTRAAAIGTAAAAVGVIAFTAIADSQAGSPRAATPTPTRPASPVPATTLPGSIDSPADGETRPRISAAQRKIWLRGLAGTWTRNVKNTYFRFSVDGTGEWVAFGQKLWTGKATPLDARNFDLSDPDGHGGSYWQVKLINRRRLLFAGTRQTFTKGEHRSQSPRPK
ncbi:MAG: hypothetical protein ACRDP6_49080 [Actinoallomurus sp.]